MGKIYISFLGTNDYLPCTYEYLNEKIKNIRFVQEATIRINCKEWSEKDRVVIFTTDKAFNRNWNDNGHKDNAGRPLAADGLETCIKGIDGNFSLHRIHIPDGGNEKEIWDIFSCVLNSIQDNDEIIFDITHAFRSIPMLAIIILNYAKIMKNVTLKGIYYGAFETLGNINGVKKLPPEKRIVPIMDLTAFDRLMEWSVAVDRFLDAGDATQISRLADSSARFILSRTSGNDRSQHTIVRLADSLEKFTKTLSTCRGRKIGDVVERLKQNLEDCKKLEMTKPLNIPLKTVLEKISAQANRFPGHFIGDGIQAARWCLEHNLIQQSYTILQETLITYFVYKIGEDQDDFSNRNLNRTIANQSAIIFLRKLPINKWKKEAQTHRDTTEKFINFYNTIPELIKTYNNLTGFRNDINHAGYNEQDKPAEKFGRKMEEFIGIVEKNILV